MKDKKMLLTVLLVVVVLSIVIFVGRGTGEAIRLRNNLPRIVAAPTPEALLEYCINSDVNQNYAGGTTAGLRRESFIPGSVRYQSRNIDTFENTVYDTCSGTSSVREYWCGGLSDNLQLYNDIVICSNGCVYGASGSYCRR